MVIPAVECRHEHPTIFVDRCIVSASAAGQPGIIPLSHFCGLWAGTLLQQWALSLCALPALPLLPLLTLAKLNYGSALSGQQGIQYELQGFPGLDWPRTPLAIG